MVFFALLIASTAAASSLSDKDASFQKEIAGYTAINAENADLLRAHNWTGHFTVFLGGHRLCTGEIDLSYFHPALPAETLAPAGAPEPTIAYRHTPRFGECLGTKKFDQIIDKLDTVKTPCDRTRQFRTTHIGSDPSQGKIFTPKCKNGKLVWKALPIQPASWISADQKTLKSMVNFTTPGPKVRVYYDLEPKREENPSVPAQPANTSAE